MGNLRFPAVERVVNGDNTIFNRASLGTRYAFVRTPKYRVTFVVSVNHVPGSVHWEALKNKANSETLNAY